MYIHVQTDTVHNFLIRFINDEYRIQHHMIQENITALQYFLRKLKGWLLSTSFLRRGDYVRGGFCPGGFCPGGFRPVGFCPTPEIYIYIYNLYIYI